MVEHGPDVRRVVQGLHQAAEAMDTSGQFLSGAVQHCRSFVARTIGGDEGAQPARAGIDVTQRSEWVGGEPEPPAGAVYASTAGRPLFGPSGIDIDKPEQGQLGDCFLIASVCAIANAEPDTIRDAFKRSGDGYEICSTYVSSALPLHDDKSFGASADGSTWVGLLEKAYASTHGGYPGISDGGWPAEALEWLTGRSSSTIYTASASEDRLQGVLAAGRSAVAASWPIGDEGPLADLADAYDVVGGHAYAVRGLDGDGRVLLHNPWGKRHPSPVPLPDFRRIFSRVDIS